MTIEGVSPWAAIHITSVAIGLLLYVKRARSFGRYRSPSAAMAWVLGLVAFPYVALPAFYILARRKLTDIPNIHWSDPQPAADIAWHIALTHSLALPPLRPAPPPQILEDGQQAFDVLVEMINSATVSVDFETFIFSDDQSGAHVIAALIAARQRGLRVRALLDDVGNRPHMRIVRNKLQQGGVDIRRFGRVTGMRSLATGNLRNHRKQVVIDSKLVWCGGRNIADEYFLAPDQKGWTDLSFVLQGPIAVDAQSVFDLDWESQVSWTERLPAIASSPQDLASVQLVPSGPDFIADTMHELLLEYIGKANQRVCIATPYFVPDDELLNALIRAQRRGVTVRLLTPGKSNHALADFVRKRSLRELSASGAAIALLPHMSHAKLVIVDDIALCGSHNFDTRSLFLNYELSVKFCTPSSVDQFANWYERQWQTTTPYVVDHPTLVMDLLEGATRSIAYQL